MIEIRLLEHAVALADQESFAVAAQTLNISQSALTRSIQALEAELGLQVFERGHRRIEPTDAGRVFLTRARELLVNHAAMAQEMGLLLNSKTASLTVASGPYAAELVVGAALAMLLAELPEVRYRLLVQSWVESVKLVRAREADLAIADISQLESDRELELTPLATVPGYFVVRRGHPLLDQEQVSVADALMYPLVSTSRLPPRLLLPIQQERGTRNGGVKNFPAVVCEQVSVMRIMVANSDAVGLFTLPLIEEELRDGSLQSLPCHAPWLETQYGIVRRRHRPLCAAGQQLIPLLKIASDAHRAKSDSLQRQFLPQSAAVAAEAMRI